MTADPNASGRRPQGIDQIDQTDDQGKSPAAPPKPDPEREALEKPLGEAKDGGLPGTRDDNTSGAGKGHW